jgi:hypothetical protein
MAIQARITVNNADGTQTVLEPGTGRFQQITTISKALGFLGPKRSAAVQRVTERRLNERQ